MKREKRCRRGARREQHLLYEMGNPNIHRVSRIGYASGHYSTSEVTHERYVSRSVQKKFKTLFGLGAPFWINRSKMLSWSITGWEGRNIGEGHNNSPRGDERQVSRHISGPCPTRGPSVDAAATLRKSCMSRLCLRRCNVRYRPMIGDGENGATRYGVLIHTQCLRIFRWNEGMKAASPWIWKTAVEMCQAWRIQFNCAGWRIWSTFCFHPCSLRVDRPTAMEIL